MTREKYFGRELANGSGKRPPPYARVIEVKVLEPVAGAPARIRTVFPTKENYSEK